MFGTYSFNKESLLSKSCPNPPHVNITVFDFNIFSFPFIRTLTPLTVLFLSSYINSITVEFGEKIIDVELIKVL